MVRKNIFRRTKKSGWLAYVDVYGFVSMLEAKKDEALSRQLSKCHEELSRLPLWDANPPHICIFSDSMFIFYPVLGNEAEEKFEVMQRCIDDVGDIMALFADKGLPLKGGIAYGELSVGENLLVGSAVVRAVQYEKMIGMPVVILPVRELLEKQSETVIVMNAPPLQIVTLKNGDILEAHVILPEHLEEFQVLARKRYDHHKCWGPYDVAKAWQGVCAILEERQKLAAGKE